MFHAAVSCTYFCPYIVLWFCTNSNELLRTNTNSIYIVYKGFYCRIRTNTNGYMALHLRTPSPPDTKKPASAGFFVSDKEGGQIQNPVRSTWVRLLGRIAQEDVDEGDARRVRAMDGPSQSHPLHSPLGGLVVCQRGWVRSHYRAAVRGFDKNAGSVFE